jgi:hypothetical protein
VKLEKLQLEVIMVTPAFLRDGGTTKFWGRSSGKKISKRHDRHSPMLQNLKDSSSLPVRGLLMLLHDSTITIAIAITITITINDPESWLVQGREVSTNVTRNDRRIRQMHPPSGTM